MILVLRQFSYIFVNKTDHLKVLYVLESYNCLFPVPFWVSSNTISPCHHSVLSHCLYNGHGVKGVGVSAIWENGVD